MSIRCVVCCAACQLFNSVQWDPLGPCCEPRYPTPPTFWAPPCFSPSTSLQYLLSLHWTESLWLRARRHKPIFCPFCAKGVGLLTLNSRGSKSPKLLPFFGLACFPGEIHPPLLQTHTQTHIPPFFSNSNCPSVAFCPALKFVDWKERQK